MKSNLPPVSWNGSRENESKVESQEGEEEKIKVESCGGWRQCGVLFNNDAALYFTGGGQ